MYENDSIIGPKVAILGLANAGKTSIILSLARQFDFLTNVKPTHGVNRENLVFMGRNFYFWDFGGQDIYRDRYLNSPEIYFDNISFVFYVIDIQDEFLLDVNVEYFKIVLNHIKEYSPNAQWILIFHKADPDFDVYTKAINIKQEFEKQVDPLLKAKNISYLKYSTSIYEPHTIIQAFSEPFVMKLGIHQSVSDILKEFCLTYSVSYAVVFTKNFFELGFYSEDEKINNIVKEYLHVFVDSSKEANKAGIDNKEERDLEDSIPEFFDISYEGYQVISIKFSVPYKGFALSFYLLIAFEESKVPFSKERFEGITEELANNFQTLFQNINLEKVF
ncbi:MAG: ADP-ribosylation factor-like protein [Promethearchaeota archaeon]